MKQFQDHNKHHQFYNFKIFILIEQIIVLKPLFQTQDRFVRRARGYFGSYIFQRIQSEQRKIKKQRLRQNREKGHKCFKIVTRKARNRVGIFTPSYFHLTNILRIVLSRRRLSLFLTVEFPKFRLFLKFFLKIFCESRRSLHRGRNAFLTSVFFYKHVQSHQRSSAKKDIFV